LSGGAFGCQRLAIPLGLGFIAMQTNKHTSGPWFRTVSQHNGETVCDICTAAENGEPKEIIARVNHCVITPGLAISNEVRANAHLIAAAPDLLAALEACQTQLAEYVAYFQKRGGCSVEIESAEEQARAAIAKAKGDA